MSRRAFRPSLAAEAALEPRISLSQTRLHVRGVPVTVYGSAVNPGRFNGLVEVTVHGRRYHAVFFNGQRYSSWNPARA